MKPCPIAWSIVGGLCLAAAGLARAPAPGREALGQYGGWGAFRDGAPARCFAIAEPVTRAPRGALPTLAIVATPGRRSTEIHVHLGHPAGAAALEVAGRRFALVVRGSEAWAADARADRAIVAALRRAEEAAVAGRDGTGGRFRDLYQLAGAPSAIDAAILGCLAR